MPKQKSDFAFAPCEGFEKRAAEPYSAEAFNPEATNPEMLLPYSLKPQTRKPGTLTNLNPKLPKP